MKTDDKKHNEAVDDEKNNSKPKAIAILSGGLDSTVATSVFVKTHEIHALTFDYGQKSVKNEVNAARKISKNLGLKHDTIKLPWLAKLGGSALTTSEEIPLIDFDELENKEVCEESADKVWVPGRNIVFTAIAISFAEKEDAELIIVGWDKEEANTFPDNSKEFLNSFNDTIAIGSKKDIEIKAPAIDLNKKEIVELAKEVNAPIELSYSCYSDKGKHCGICESCLRRKRAFIEAKIEDPTKYIQ